MIPQLDGQLEDITVGEKASQNKAKTLKQAEAQTKGTESNLTVKWCKRGKIPLPPGTFILKHEGGFNLDDFPLDYPVMSPPATGVLHPICWLGKIEDDDDGHYFYRFNGKEVHSGEKKKV